MPEPPATKRQARASARFKRCVTLAIYWEDGELMCENYLSRSRTCINPQGIELLNYFREWRTGQECAKDFPGYSRASVVHAMDEMVRLNLLVREGSRQAGADAACGSAWAHWLPYAGLLHFGTRDLKYAASEEEVGNIIAGMESSPQPPFSKSHAGASVELPKPIREETGLLDVLSKRRTHRSFSREALRLEHLSALLHYTWGVTGHLDVPRFGRLPLKTSPSGGARHPEEVYVAALRVEGLKRGLYHYAADRHCLEWISKKASPHRAVDYCVGQEWVGDAAALFIMTAVFTRTMWKYRFPRAYRVVLAEAGHFCQTFCLVACSLGLAPFCTMALKDSMIEGDLGLNGFEESVLYVAGVGAPPASDVASAPPYLASLL